MNQRVGLGFDVHRLSAGRRLVLGGVEIPHEKGLLGHSDADALIHAVCDALLGAAGLGDIGQRFPDSDMRYKNISSLILLKETGNILAAAGYSVVNVDVSVAAEAPKLSPHYGGMRSAMAGALGVDPSAFSVKATTAEGLGFAGRGEGIAAWAVAMVERRA